MIFSHSRIECFEKCPRCFKYKYIKKVPELFDTVERFMGSRVHEALEGLYASVKAGGLPPLNEVLGSYNRLWERNFTDDVVVNGEGKTHADYMIVGERCISDYYTRHEPFNQADIISCEMRINADLLGDGNYKLVGFIDRVDRRGDGCLEIHDYKTGKRVPSQNKVDSDRQLAIYEIGLRQKFNNLEDVEYVWHYLAHDRMLRSKNTPDELETQKNGIIKSIHQIEECIVEDWFPPKKTPRCAWCEYKSICDGDDNSNALRQSRINDF